MHAQSRCSLDFISFYWALHWIFFFLFFCWRNCNRTVLLSQWMQLSSVFLPYFFSCNMMSVFSFVFSLRSLNTNLCESSICTASLTSYLRLHLCVLFCCLFVCSFFFQWVDSSLYCKIKNLIKLLSKCYLNLHCESTQKDFQCTLGELHPSNTEHTCSV